MDNVNIILIILGVILFVLIIFILIFLKPESVSIDKTINTEPKKIFETIKINKDENDDNDDKYDKCQQTLVADYDEIDLNIVKKNALDTKIDLETEQKTFNPKDKLKKIPYVRTYMDLPGYKPYNLESLNSMELKDNNHGLINYNELKSDERFKAKNSLI
jgi:hypothetical protein